MRGAVAQMAKRRRLEPAYVDADVVAAYLGIGRTKVYDMAARGDIPHYRIGRLVKFRLEEIDRWMGQQHEGPEV